MSEFELCTVNRIEQRFELIEFHFGFFSGFADDVFGFAVLNAFTERDTVRNADQFHILELNAGTLTAVIEENIVAFGTSIVVELERLRFLFFVFLWKR